jgi:hypothetical protein
MLPGMPEAPERPAGDDRSRRRSWTVHARRLVAAGIHPLTRGPARPDLGTCGDCRFRVLVDYHARKWPKCERGPRTHGEQTDVRAWWPACPRFEPGDGISDDAARWTPDHATR